MNGILIGTAGAVLLLLLAVPLFEVLVWHLIGLLRRLRKRHVPVNHAILSAHRGRGFVILNLGYEGPRGVFYVATSTLSPEEVVQRFKRSKKLRIYGAWSPCATKVCLRHAQTSANGRVIVLYPTI
jgi:hypothetical protein